MLGTDRYRVIAWENKGQIPDAEHRNRLAELNVWRNEDTGGHGHGRVEGRACG